MSESMQQGHVHQWGASRQALPSTESATSCRMTGAGLARRDAPVPGDPLQAAHPGSPVARQRLPSRQGPAASQVQAWRRQGQREQPQGCRASGQACCCSCPRQAMPQPCPALQGSQARQCTARQSRPSAFGQPVPSTEQHSGAAQPGDAAPGAAALQWQPCPQHIPASERGTSMGNRSRSAGRPKHLSSCRAACCAG